MRSVKPSNDAQADHCSYACLATRQALADPHTLAAKTTIFPPIQHLIGTPIILIVSMKMASKA